MLRDGQHVGDVDVEDTSKEELITMMVGHSLESFFHVDEMSEAPKQADVVLEVRNLSRSGTALDPDATVLENVSFDLRRGEILGLAGLVGAGRTELARTIFGADKRESGEIIVEGAPVPINSPQDAIALGLGLLPEDRKEQGLILGMAVRQNMSLVDLAEFTHLGFVQRRRETQTVMDYVNRFEIRTPDIERRVVNLSGGNQQKVVISKWLMVKPKILIMDEPTRGIDVGAKSDIYDLMHQLGVGRHQHHHDLVGVSGADRHVRPHRLPHGGTSDGRSAAGRGVPGDAHALLHAARPRHRAPERHT